MRKLRKWIWAILLFAALVGVLTACRQNSVERALKNVEGESYRMILGRADSAQLKFEVWENGEYKETLQVSEEMLSQEDREKFIRAGKHTVTVNYRNMTLPISFVVEAEITLSEFIAAFYSEPGAFADGTTEKTATTENRILAKFDTPEREGYSFAGWYRDRGYSGEPLVTPYPMTENLKFYAKWRDLRSYAVTFYNGKTNGVISTVADVEHGTAVSCPNPPMMEAYEFIGWKTIDGKEVDLENITSNLSVYATYRDKTFTVTYYDENGEIVKQTIVTYGNNYTDLLPAPQKAGYTGKWEDESTGRAPEVYQNIRKNIVIRAKFEINVYEFRFVYYLDDASNELRTPVTKADDVIRLEYGRALQPDIIPKHVAVNGYDGQWVIRDQGRYVAADERLRAPATEDITVYVRYVRSKYTVRFFRGVTMLKEIPEVNYLDQISAEDVPALDTFNAKYQTAEWYENERFDETRKVVFPYTVKSTVNFYVKVSEKERLVDFALPNADSDGNPLDIEFVQTYTDADSSNRPIIQSVKAGAGAYITVPMVSNVKYQVDEWRYADGTVVDLQGNRFRVDDFYEYDEGKAIVAVISVRFYTVIFHNWTITTDGDGILQYEFPVYSADTMQYGTKITATPEEKNDFAKPKYPGDDESTFNFGGWYASTVFHGAPIDFSGDGQTVVGETNYYPRWYDEARGTEGLQFEYVELEEDDGYYAVTGYSGTDANISVPRTWSADNSPNALVRKFNSNAFANSALVGVEGIVSIQFFADTVTMIEEGAFTNLPNLHTVEITGASPTFQLQNGILYRLEGSEKTVLLCPAKNPSLSADFVLDSDVVAIGKSAFMNVGGLRTLEFSGSTLGEGAFSGCDNLTSITLNSVQTIGESVFVGCYDLSEINLGTQLTEAYTNAFVDTAWYENELDQEQDCVVLGDVLLAYLGTETSFTVPNEVKNVATGAFDKSVGGNLDTLQEITFGKDSNLKSIGAKAFADCYNLTRVKILCGTATDDCVNIAPDAFYGIKAGAVLIVNTQTYASYQTYAPVLDYFGTENIRLMVG